MLQKQQNDEITGEKLFKEVNCNAVNNMYFFLKIANIIHERSPCICGLSDRHEPQGLYLPGRGTDTGA